MSVSPGIDGIGQIHISVQDVPRAVEFYRDTLGMPLLFEVPEQSMAFFDCGGIRLYLGKAESEEFRSNPLIYYRVTSIEEAYGALIDRGVEPLAAPHAVHATDSMELWIAGLKDPEGNALFLMSEVGKESA